MKNIELHKQRQRLNNLFQKVSAATGGDIELQSHWAKYLCILVAGFLENSISELYSEMVTRTSSPRVAKFAVSRLERLQNPKMEKFIEVAGAFDQKWAADLRAYSEDDGRKDAVDSIMANRHLIAHGNNSGITLVQLRTYFDKAILVVEFIEQQCEP